MSDDASYLRRFGVEAEAARQLHAAQTRRLARYLGDGVGEHPPWLACEYVPGLTLAEAVRPDHDMPGRPLPRELLAGLALGLAQALAEVHGRRLVHRDLKPSNVVLAWDGPTVTDFGTTLPEQHVGADLSPHTDVFSWGACIAYALFGSWRSREDLEAALAAQES
nr:protein kinase [Micromonospora sp. DSM 115978]